MLKFATEGLVHWIHYKNEGADEKEETEDSRFHSQSNCNQKCRRNKNDRLIGSASSCKFIPLLLRLTWLDQNKNFQGRNNWPHKSRIIGTAQDTPAASGSLSVSDSDSSSLHFLQNTFWLIRVPQRMVIITWLSTSFKVINKFSASQDTPNNVFLITRSDHQSI